MKTRFRLITGIFLNQWVITISVSALLCFFLAACQSTAFTHRGGKSSSVPAQVTPTSMPDNGIGIPPIKNVATPSRGAAVASVNTEPILAPLRASGAEPFCLQLADTDGDSQMEWIGLRERKLGETPVISGFVLDGNQFYPLGIADQSDPNGGFTLGEMRICEMIVRDITGNGRPQIAIWGQLRGGIHQLTIFQWDVQTGYNLVASFAGDEKPMLVDRESDGNWEIIVRNRVSPGVMIDEVSAWDGQKYAYVHIYHSLQTGYVGPLPNDTAERALLAFYLNLQRRDLVAAYSVLSPALQSRQGFEQFVLSVAAVSHFELGELRRLTENDDEVTFSGMLTLTQLGEMVTRRAYQGEWKMIRLDASWRLDKISLIGL